MLMDQQAPYPDELADLVATLTYKKGWMFELRAMERGQGCSGLTLNIRILTPNSYDDDRPMIVVSHMFGVPAAAYNRASWQRWLFDHILLVEQHEAMEFFAIDGDKVFAPRHAPGNDPYTVVEWSDLAGRRTPGAKD